MLTALVASDAGEIFELDGYAAVGMAGAKLAPLTVAQTRRLPFGSELMMLPDRKPVLLNIDTGKLETLHENPYDPGEMVYPVAAFNSPGYVITRISAYGETRRSQTLPLFSYGAVGWHADGFRSAVVQVDAEPRQDLRQMPRDEVIAGVERMRRQMPDNRLRAHLENCALTYGCPAGKNFFLGRYEAPLPTAQACNARCLGCLSLQQNSDIHHSQDRIAFTPSPQEIAEVALAHITQVDGSVVSFGQGCEGDPLLADHVIGPAIEQIRSQTDRGTINMNTNGSLPDRLPSLFDAGLDSIRISMNSVRKACYDAYFRPRGYGFADVLASIETALARKKFVAVNYLNCPGFSDTPAEAAALEQFLEQYPIHMIQWRNLNFDPVRYWRQMDAAASSGEPIGMEVLLKQIRQRFPNLKFGYFNPPKEKFSYHHRDH
ncbi:MAG: radical SAM protein [Deltaproteobacteria bacterium]|jgi:molybdenum cofactor biosynthesis enzyme MoaA|nr:radical SAM protein [Deltaproteobacteria bacterium]